MFENFYKIIDFKWKVKAFSQMLYKVNNFLRFNINIINVYLHEVSYISRNIAFTNFCYVALAFFDLNSMTSHSNVPMELKHLKATLGTFFRVIKI